MMYARSRALGGRAADGLPLPNIGGHRTRRRAVALVGLLALDEEVLPGGAGPPAGGGHRQDGHGRPPLLALLLPLPRGLAGLAQNLDGQEGQFGFDGILDGGAFLVVVHGGAGGGDAAQVVDDADEGRLLGVHLGAGRGEEPSAVGNVFGMDAQVQRGAAVGVLMGGGISVAPEEELDDGRLVPRGRGVVEGCAIVGVDISDGGGTEAVDGPEDVDGGVVAAGGVQDARGQGLKNIGRMATFSRNRVVYFRGMLSHIGEKSSQIVPRMTLDEFHAGLLTRLLGLGEREIVGHLRLDGGDAAGDGQSSDGAGYRTGEAALLAGTGGAGGAAADARDVGDANPLLGEHAGKVVCLAFGLNWLGIDAGVGLVWWNDFEL